jgi:hypothetical protein
MESNMSENHSHRNPPIFLDCVLREVSPGDFEYVPLSEVPSKEEGETVYRGYFSTHKENHGPSGSHVRTICLPVGDLTKVK